MCKVKVTRSRHSDVTLPLIDGVITQNKTELRQDANMSTVNYSNDVITEAHDSCRWADWKMAIISVD